MRAPTIARRLARAAQVARVDRVERSPASVPASVARLRAARVVERRVGVALPAPSRFQSVSPWRTSRIVGHAGVRLAARGSRPPRPRLRRHRLDRRDRARDRAPARRRGRARRHVRAASAGGRPEVGEALHVAADLAEPGEPEQAVVEALRGARPASTCLVNNVGDRLPGDASRSSTDEQWDEMWQLNVMSYVRAIRAVLPGMRERGERRDRERLLDRRASGRRPGCRTTR